MLDDMLDCGGEVVHDERLPPIQSGRHFTNKGGRGEVGWGGGNLF